MNEYLSNKLSFFSFWLMVLVVALHSLNIELAECDSAICYFQYVLSYKLAQVAVPLFFFISGYLFFTKYDLKKNINFSIYKLSLARRAISILLPYILWCTLWFVIIYIVQYLPLIRDFYTQPLHLMSMSDKLLNLFYYPLNYPFWFLRELMVIIILTPLVFVLIKFFKIYFLILLFIISLFMEKILKVNSFTILSSSPTLFFCIGAYSSLNKFNINFKRNSLALILLFMATSILIFISVRNDMEYFFDADLKRGFDLVRILVLSFSIWYLYDYINMRKQWINFSFYKYSFFIFAVHGIPTIMLSKLSAKVFEANHYMLTISYLFIILLITSISIIIAKMMQKIMPKTYNVFSGSRI